MQKFVAAMAATLLATTVTAQFTVVVPNGTATTEGNSANAFPWGRGGTGLLISNIYDSSNFTAQGVNFPIVINQLRWRIDAGVARTWVNSAYQTASVSLSTCPVDWASAVAGAPMSTFEGADKATCFNGPVSWLAGTTAPPGPAATWAIDIPLTTPFIYDPTQGDLNIETDLPIQTFTGTQVQLDVQTTGSQSTRVYISAGYPTGATAVTLNHGVVVEVGYTPANGLYAGFSANVTGGPSPLNVQFTDSTFTSAPGGVTSWAWDFNGDSIIDSNLQNPTHTYTSCGTYTVSLTVTDGVNPNSTLTRTNYIDTDVVTPSFTVAPIAAGVFQFTDTSTPTPTAWAWDFNGDSIVDSTVQNPVWAFTSTCGAQAVSLAATRLCKGPYTASQSVLLAPNTFVTGLAGGNGLTAVNSGNTFDIQVTNPAGVTICAIDMAPYMATPVLGTALGCTVWITDAPGGYLANHTNAAVWRQVATGTGTFAGGTFTAPVPVTMALSTPIYVPFGTYGVAVHMTTGSGVAYTNVTAPFTYNGPDFNITAGNGKGAPFSGTANAGRAWNGRVHYSTPTAGGLAGYGFFGAGCAGTLGITHVLATSQPTIGGTLSTTLDNLQFGIAVMVIGLSNTLSGGTIPLPLDLGFLGAPGCPLRVSLDVTATIVGAGTTANWSFAIPNQPTLLGFQLYNQAAPLDSSNAFGLVTSDAYAWVVGN